MNKLHAKITLKYYYKAYFLTVIYTPFFLASYLMLLALIFYTKGNLISIGIFLGAVIYPLGISPYLKYRSNIKTSDIKETSYEFHEGRMAILGKGVEYSISTEYIKYFHFSKGHIYVKLIKEFMVIIAEPEDLLTLKQELLKTEYKHLIK